MAEVDVVAALRHVQFHNQHHTMFSAGSVQLLPVVLILHERKGCDGIFLIRDLGDAVAESGHPDNGFLPILADSIHQAAGFLCGV